MGKIAHILLFACALTSLNFEIIGGRSSWRPRDPQIPELRVRWSDGSHIHYLREHCLEYHALFCKYNPTYFKQHMLPEGPITYRNAPEKSIDSQVLRDLATKVLKEIRAHKKSYSDFKVLKNADFNPQLASGLIILKYKEYPFVLKLFIKTPETFVKQSEGIIPKFLFRMGGGINRHLSGFTRVPNLEKIKDRIAESDYWSARVDTPRKWFWEPEDNRYITLESDNIGTKGHVSITLPSVYGIIVDAIDVERTLSLYNNTDCETSLAFSHFVGNRMDAHVDNLLVEKGTGKYVIIDTEHFPTMVGLKEPLTYKTYQEWYLKLSGICWRANFSMTKVRRRKLQENPQQEILALFKEEEYCDVPAPAA